MNKNLEYDVERNIDDIDCFRYECTSDLMSNSINMDVVSELTLCLYEILVNIVDHSTIVKNKSEIIDVKLEITQDKIISTVHYFAPKFDITQKRINNLEVHFKEGYNRGLGLFIIQKLMDMVDYKFDDYNNTITIIKNFKKYKSTLTI